MKGPITPCLWFNNQAEEAANFYISIFKNSRMLSVSRYPKEGFEVHHQKEGTAMTAVFEINGQKFTALNGGDIFKFSEAVSFQVFCDTQEEIDYYWEKLSAVPEAEQCGWLQDKYGVSWQITPENIEELLKVPGAFKRMMDMHKLDIATLQKTE